METAAFLPGAEIEHEVIGEGITRQILGFNNQIMMVKIYFEAGSVGYVHDHFHSQVTYVESGKFEVTIGDETQTMVACDSYYMAPHIQHGSSCVETGVLIDVFSPIREDFIESSL